MPADIGRALLVGRYRVVRPLGSGGMATVFLCVDERLGREVAVKRLHASSPDDMARRFAREARLGAGLNHESLVTVYDTATDDEGVLIVMEHVPGRTLREALRDGPLPPATVARIVSAVAAGLDHAHARGVVHRDVKPANILVRDDGAAKLADLGIAVARDATRITASGTVLGTAAYMAPEQLDGESSTPAADVYALAAVAYEALTGQRARRGKSALEIARQLATEPPPDARDLCPDLPAGAAEALREGMDREPSRRPRSAGAFAALLDAGLHEPPTRRLSGGLQGAPVGATRRSGAAPLHAPAPQPGRTGIDHPRAASPRAPVPQPGRVGIDRHPGAASPRASAPQAGHPGGRPASAPHLAHGRRRSAAPAGRRILPFVVAGALALIAIAVVAVVLSGGGSGPDRGGAIARQPDAGATGGGQPERGSAQADDPGSGEGASGSDPGGSGAGEGGSGSDGGGSGYAVPDATGADAGRAADLNSEGFALLRQGRFDEAIPLLEEAVRLAPPDSVDPYAYALFNLGSALRQAGRPADAVRVLERRLQVPDQQETVREELDLARGAARG